MVFNWRYICKLNAISISLLYLLFYPSVSYSVDSGIGRELNLSRFSYITGYADSFWVIDGLILENKARHFYDANNNLIFSGDENIYSIYDDSVTMSANNYFKRNYRLNLTGLYKTNRKGEFILFGLDSGVFSDKLKIAPAIKLGYVNTIMIKKQFYISFGASKWYGGTISEIPCVDSYDRLYSCRNLISWLDRIPLPDLGKVSYGIRFTYLY